LVKRSMGKRIRPKRVKTTTLKSKKGGIKMNAIELAESNVQLTCLTEISVIIQDTIKKKGLTSEEIDKSFGLVRKHNVKRKN